MILKTVKFFLVYFISYIILLLLFFLVSFIFLPDVSIWSQKNPRPKDFLDSSADIVHNSNLRNKVFYKWYPLNQIPAIFIKTIIVAEDASFWIHNGIDWFEVKESIKKNVTEGEFSRGGSTITQQVVKNLYLSSEKTISRKLSEWIISWKMDKELKKSRILELYLNIAQWGEGIYGVYAASKFYFGKQPDYLDLHEMVRLAAVLPNPIKMRPDIINKAVYWRSEVILERLLKYNYITLEDFEITSQIINELYQN